MGLASFLRDRLLGRRDHVPAPEVEQRSAPEGRLYRLDWGADVTTASSVPSGVRITPDSALTVSAYFAAINRIASDVGSHPFRVLQRVPGQGRLEVPDHPLTRLRWHPLAIDRAVRLDDVAGDVTRTKVLTAWVAHELGWGIGALRIRYDDGSGWPTGLQLLDPTRTVPRHRADGTLVYQVGAQTLAAHEVLHLSGLSYDGLNGYSVARYARETLGLAKSQEYYGARWFGTGGAVKGVLSTDQVLGEDAVKNLRESLAEHHDNLGASRKWLILEQGLKYQGLTVAPEDSQFLQSRQFQLVEVARWFGLPPHKIGDYSQMQLASAGVEAANLDYLTSVILVKIARIEDEWNQKLLSEAERAAGYEIDFDVSWLLRADLKTRAEYNREALAWGWETRNEVREREGRNPIAGGDEVLVPANMVPLNRLLAATDVSP